MSFFQRRYATLFIVIVAVAFFTRVWNVHKPEQYLFDEVYHAVTAKLIAENDPRAYEWWNEAPEPNTAVDWLHPPLAKYTQAAGILLFGEHTFGWRFSSALFGTGVIALTMLLAKQLFGSARVSLLAGVLASSDGLLLTLSRIAMNDIHVTFFVLLTLFLYTKSRPVITSEFTNTPGLAAQKKSERLYFLAACVSAGFAIGSKWSGVFVLGLLIGWEGIFTIWHVFAKHSSRLITLVQAASRLTLLLVIPASIYLLSYSHMFLQGKDFAHFYELHQQIWWYQTQLTATHPYQSTPAEWFITAKPVWFYVQYLENETRADIYAMGNPALFWLGAVMVGAATGWLLLSSPFLQKRKLTVAFLLSAYAIVWMPWLLSPRIMFFYHYTPAVPLLCIIVAWALLSLWKQKSILFLSREVVRSVILLLVGLIILTAIVWYPHWTGIPMPLWLKEHVYFAVPSWK